MGSRILERSTDLPISLQEIKLNCRIDHDDEDSTVIRLFWAAVEHAEFYQQRLLVPTTIQVPLDRFSNCISLPLPPSLEILQVQYVDPDGQTQILDSENYQLDIYSEPAVLRPAFGVNFPATRCQPNAVLIDVAAGYSIMPSKTLTAILLHTSHLFENREAVVTGTIATTLPFGLTSLLDADCWGNYS